MTIAENIRKTAAIMRGAGNKIPVETEAEIPVTDTVEDSEVAEAAED